MAYALVAWRRDGDEAPVEAALDALPRIPLFPGFFLVDQDGPSWSTVKDHVQNVVEQNPGTEAVIIMPARGARVGGWVDTAPAPEALKKAREIMNRKGSTTVPVLFATPDIEPDGG